MTTTLTRAFIAHLILPAAVVLAACGNPATPAQPRRPTFNKDIAPLVWERCGSCHRPGRLAPFSLVEYVDVASRARQIAAATKNRLMPPWLPEPGYGEFANDRHLRDEEILLIEAWVQDGAPEGHAADLPRRPEWVDGWQLGNPDLVVELPEPYTLRPGEADVFRNFVIPIPVDSTRYVRGIEIRPGNWRVVHHADTAIDGTRAARRLDEMDPEPGFAGGMILEGARNPGNRAITWTPGMIPAMEPAGMAWRLGKGTDLVLLLHMMPPGSGEPVLVQPSVGFFFTQTPPTRMPLDFKLGSKTIDIPAGKPDYSIEDTYELPVDVDVLSVYPHAHYLAKEMKAFATLPDGTVKWLIWIKDWNFHWQDEYRFATPLFFPKGTVVTMRYTYDNSAGNERNPHSPPKRVLYGPQSTDEMGDLWLRLVPRTAAAAAATLARSYVDNELRKDIAAAEQMIAQHPREAKWRDLLGASYLKAGNVQEAIAQLEEALRLEPRDAEAQNNLGHAMRLQGRLVEAIPHFRQAVRLSPRNDLVHLNLANALRDTGELDEAIRHFRRAIELNPDAADAHNNLGVALASKGMIDDAARHFRLALDIQPDYADARKNLGLAERLQKEPDPPR